MPPSSREALRTVLEALRPFAETMERRGFIATYTACVGCGDDVKEPNAACHYCTARAALTACNERERLGDDSSGLLGLVGGCLSDFAHDIDVDKRGRFAVALLGAIDRHLFGTPTSGDTPESAKINSRNRGAAGSVRDVSALAVDPAGNPTAEVQARGPDLSPSSVTPRAPDCKKCKDGRIRTSMPGYRGWYCCDCPAGQAIYPHLATPKKGTP